MHFCNMQYTKCSVQKFKYAISKLPKCNLQYAQIGHVYLPVPDGRH